ncbi:mannitol dehydrogenase [Spirochaetia bacterium]|nr:mannitol dehydrogenase [Spirochaetia bacterium]
MNLNQKNLSAIKTTNAAIPGVAVPAYNRNSLKSAIVHIGLGNFHRAHQAFFLDTLLEKGVTGTGIYEINLVPTGAPIGDILKAQDYLYTLLTKSRSGQEVARVIGSITGYTNVSQGVAEKRRLIEKIASEETALVSLTITEKGYCFNPANFTLDLLHPAIVHDIAEPPDPQSAVAFLAASLNLRAHSNKQPLTIMSCDNFPSNGTTLKRLVRAFCERVYPESVQWIEDNAAFPCSMVDRITPNTTDANAGELKEKFGIVDLWPVCSEDYIQWVLEDNFRLPPRSAFNPADLALAGVQLVKDVEPYERMKQRILNGSHSALAYLSYLMGYRKVDEALGDRNVFRFVRNCYMEQAGATLPPVPGIDIAVYKDTTAGRFCNHNISDTILRLCEDGSAKIPNFILNPLKDAVHKGLPYSAFVFALACWARFLAGADEQRQPIPLNDPNAQVLSITALKAREEPDAFLLSIGIAELPPGAFSSLAALFKEYVQRLYELGARRSLEQFLEDTDRKY